MSAPVILVCGTGASARALARAFGTAPRVCVVPLPAGRLTTDAATSAAARDIDRAWRALGGVDAVVICANLSIGPRRRNPGVGSWRTGLGGTLRAGYVAARAAGLALARQGRGTLVIVTEPPAAADAVAVVASEGLSCLADGLARALAPDVRVAEVSRGPGRRRPTVLARAILAIIGAAPGESLPTVRSRAGSLG